MLDLGSALAKGNNFASISSSSYASVAGDGIIAFQVKVDFGGALINNDTTLAELNGNEVLKPEIVFASDPLLGGRFDSDISFNLQKGEVSKSVNLKNNKLIDNNSLADLKGDLNGLLGLDSGYTIQVWGNKLQILSGDSFKIEADLKPGAFTDLKLSGAKLQQVFSVELPLPGEEITLTLNKNESSSNETINETIKIKLPDTPFNSPEQAVSWLNNYLNDFKNQNEVGYSLSNYYGIYASYAEINNGVIKVDFACDHFRMKDYLTASSFFGFGSSKQYMLQSSEILHSGRFSSSSEDVLVFNVFENDEIKSTLNVNTSNCHSLSDLVSEIEKQIKNKDELIGIPLKVSLSDNRIVFSAPADSNLSITFDEKPGTNFKLNTSITNAFNLFVEGVENPTPITLKEFSNPATIGGLLAHINTQSQSVEFKIDGDHIVASSSKSFTLESVYSNTLLEILGFNKSAQAEKAKNEEYRITGRSLLERDFAERFSFTISQLELNASVSLGSEVDFDVVPDGDGKVKLSLSKTETNLVLQADDYLLIGGAYYKIINVATNDDRKYTLEVSSKGLVIPQQEIQEIKVISECTKAQYVGVLAANLGFVDALVFAHGNVSLKAGYLPPKSQTGEPLPQIKISDVLNKFSAEGSGIFEMSSLVLLGSQSFNVGAGSVTLSVDGQKPSLSTDFKINNDLLKELNDFSVEALLGLLDNFVLKIRDMTKSMDYKLPLINKSVSDLVSVAENLTDIISAIRKSGVSSLQGFEALMNKQLEDAGFSLFTVDKSDLTSSKFPFALEILTDAEGKKSLSFAFNFQKDFQKQEQFSFEAASGNLSGDAKLEVKGFLGLSFAATLKKEGSSWNFILNDPIKMNAGLQVIGEKLSFDMGLDLGTAGDDSSFLSKLIEVGADDDSSFLALKVSVSATVGQAGTEIKEISFAADKGPDEGGLNVEMDVQVYGRLAVSIGEFSFGDIVIGIYKGGENGVDSLETLNDVLIKFGEKNLTPTILKNVTPSFDLLLGEEQPNPKEGTFVVDLSTVINSIKNLGLLNLDLFDKLKLAVSGLDLLFGRLESSLNKGLAEKIRELPIVGNPLSKGVDFLSTIHNEFIDPFSDFVYSVPNLDAKLIAEQFNGWLNVYLNRVDAFKPNGDGWSGDDKVQYRSVEGKAEWFFSLAGTYSVGQNLDFDLGFPGLSMETKGGVDLSLNWQLNFGFGISTTLGFYLILPEGDDVKASLEVVVDGALLGSLGGLGLKIDASKDSTDEKHKLEFVGKIGLDLNSSFLGNDEVVTTETEEVRFGSILSLAPKFSYEAKVDINLGITLGVVSDLSIDATSAAPKFPNITADFVFNWEKNIKKDAGATSQFGFQNIEMDMGMFISDVLGPIIRKIQSVIEPLEPLIHFLTTPFPVLDDLGFVVTPLSLAKEFSPSFDDSMIYAIKDLIDMANKINGIATDGNTRIPLGNYMLLKAANEFEEDQDRDDAIAAEKFLKGETSNKKLLTNVTSYIEGGEAALGGLAEAFNKSLSGILPGGDKKAGETAGTGEKPKQWSFIWDNPSDIFKLFLGENIDLVHYDMPALNFSFNWDKFFRIYGPLGVRTGVSFGATIDLAFGYDTLGIKQWIASDYKNHGCLVNGFYVDDLKDGIDVNELTFYGGLCASAELNAGVNAGIGGGVDINVGINLFDPNGDGKVRLNEIAETVKYDGPFGLFDINGSITAKLYAYVDLLFYTKKWNITGDITLFDFNFEHKRKPVMLSSENGDVVANVGDNSDNRINGDLTDGDEELTLEVKGRTVSWKIGENTGPSIQVKEGGRLLIDSGKGKDKIVITGNASFDIEIHGGEGDDFIDLSGLTMNNPKGADEVYSVVIYGDAGNDIILGAQNVRNIIFGDNGSIREVDNKTIIESIVDSGVSGNDVIIGGSGNDIIFGGSGNDQIDGREGDDIIIGDGGRVTITDGSIVVDRTMLSAEGGSDILIGGSGDDLLYGGAGNDFIDGGSGNDLIYGEEGHDRILGGTGNDIIYGGNGMDLVFGDRFSGTEFDFTSQFVLNDETAFTKEFLECYGTIIESNSFKIKDYPKGKADYSEVKDEGEFGSDKIYGGDGNDLIFGDGGSLTIAEGGNDYIEGGAGHDIINADGGDDTIFGGLGNDTIYGGAGDDKIYSGSGNNTIYGDTGVSAYTIKTKSDTPFDELTYGNNLGLGGFVKGQTSNADAAFGNDQIYVGSGMNFIDGQNGSDTIYVEFMGDSTLSYTNIFDTGLSSGDSLLIEGTNNDDHILIRSSKNELGFVALLPTESGNSNIERVNFLKSIDHVSLNTGLGDDFIAIDGTLVDMTIDGGFGNDTFQIGQVYKSKRDSQALVNPDDEFNVEETIDGFLSDGVSKNTKLDINGGLGDDSFNLYHNAGELSLNGDAGNDLFSITGFIAKETNKVVENEVLSIDGGDGTDSMKLRGTVGEDTFVISKAGIASNVISVAVEGVESTTIDASSGDDTISIIGNNANDVTIINGGEGNDTVIAGGLLEDVVLRNGSVIGQTSEISHTIVNGENADATFNKVVLPNASFSIIDTSTSPVVVLLDAEERICTSGLSITEGGLGSFFVSYGGVLSANESIKVTISVPTNSPKAIQSGKRGLLLSTDSSNLEKTIEVTLNASALKQEVFVHSLLNVLTEGLVHYGLLIKSELRDSSGEIKNLNNGMSSLAVKVTDIETASELPLIAFTETFNIKKDSLQAEVVLTLSQSDEHLFVYLVNRQAPLMLGTEYTIEENELTLSSNFLEEMKIQGEDFYLYVHHRTSSIALNSSSFNLAYDDIEIESITTHEGKVIRSSAQKNGDAPLDANTSYNEDYYYIQNGNQVSFYSLAIDKLRTLKETLTIVATKTAPEDNAVSAVSSSTSLPAILVEQSSDLDNTNYSEATYTVKLSKAVAEGKNVYVKVSPQETAFRKNESGSVDKAIQLSVSAEGYALQEDGSIILVFNSSNWEIGIEVTTKAITDDSVEDTSLAYISKGSNSISDIDGAVYAYGNGSSGDDALKEAVVLTYNHMVMKAVETEGQIKNELVLVPAETNSYASNSLISFTVVENKLQFSSDGLDIEESDLLHKTIQFVSTNPDASDSDWFRIEEAVYVEAGSYWELTLNQEFSDYASSFKALLGVNRDYLFADELASTDRFFVNNQDSNADALGALTAFGNDGLMADDPFALRFGHDSINELGISLSDFEYAELNLGSGDDTFDLSKTLYREDGFQTFTVVNSGEGNDNITVSSYQKEKATLIAIASNCDMVESVNPSIYTYQMGSFTIETDYVEADLSECVGVYAEVLFANGSTQRRAVSSLDVVNGQFTLTRDFTATGSEQISVRFITGLSGDDQLVINGEGGDDAILARGEGISREGMIIFGGMGSDKIEVDNSAYVFGDTGVITYGDDSNKITTLGDKAGADNLQTDGVRRSAFSFKTTNDDVSNENEQDDEVLIYGSGNIVFGGAGADLITITDSQTTGEKTSGNVVFGDGGSLVFENSEIDNPVYGDSTSGWLHFANSTNDAFGGSDVITTGDGDNIVFGGADADLITTLSGNDIILGDGGSLELDQFGNPVLVSNVGQTHGGDDIINAGTGNNTVFGGVGNDTISTGVDTRLGSSVRDHYSNDADVVLGDNGYRTFGGTASQNDSSLDTTGVISFNFQGTSSSKVLNNQTAGFGGFAAVNWNNISGSLSGTYGNDPSEVITLSNGKRITGISISYGGFENNRVTSTDNVIQLQGYTQSIGSNVPAGDSALMGSGLLTTAPNDQNKNSLGVELDGLSQHFNEYDVVVYLDAPSAHSASVSSVRRVTLYVDDVAVQSYYVNDVKSNKFNGNYVVSTATTAAQAIAANCVVFTGISSDRIKIKITDGIGGVLNGSNLPSIAGIQIKGCFHAKDVISSSEDIYGGNDIISTGGGNDIVIGGVGDDTIATFGDVRYGSLDADLVFGDNAKVILADRDGDGVSDVLEAFATGFLGDVSHLTFNDIILTGNGNDVVIGGEGMDRLLTLAQDELSSQIFENSGISLENTPQAVIDLLNLQSLETEGVKAFSLNFMNDNTSNSSKISGYAGVVADSNWNNMYLYNNQFVSAEGGLAYSNDGEKTSLNGVGVTISAYNVGSQNNGNNSSLTKETHNQVDNSSENSKLFNNYLAAHREEQIQLNLSGLNKIAGNSPYDVYVYLDSENAGTDTYNYIYQLLSSSNDSSYSGDVRYLNDWTGSNFNGEFREATANTIGSTNNGVTPSVSMSGNYVVFRNVTGSNFSVILRNFYTGAGQWPMSLPCIAGIQIVVNDLEKEIPKNGDYDNDVALGDNGSVSFAFDLPYAVDENIKEYANKIVSAVSNVNSFASGIAPAMNDFIVTGRGQDTIIGGNGSDAIDSGKGNDVIIGDNASVQMLDYNPIGVRIPNAETILDEHQVNNNNNGVYIDQSGVSSNSFKSKWEQGLITGIDLLPSEWSGNDLIDAGHGSDFVIDTEGANVIIANKGPNDVQITNPESTVKSSANYQNENDYLADLNSILAKMDDNDKSILNVFAEEDFSALPSLGSFLTESGSPDEGNTGDEGNNSAITVYDLSNGAKTITFAAGETVEIVSSTWPGNQWWTPNIVLVANSVSGNATPKMEWSWVNTNGTTTAVETSSGYYFTVNVPDSPNEQTRYVIRVKALSAGSVNIALGNA